MLNHIGGNFSGMPPLMKRFFPTEPIWTIAFAAGVLVFAALAMLRVEEPA